MAEPERTVAYDAVIGLELARRRRIAGVSQEVAADAIGVTQPTYSRMEAGRTAVSIRQFWRLAHALGIAPHALLERVEHTVEALTSAGFRVPDHSEARTTVSGAMLEGLLIGLTATKKDR